MSRHSSRGSPGVPLSHLRSSGRSGLIPIPSSRLGFPDRDAHRVHIICAHGFTRIADGHRRCKVTLPPGFGGIALANRPAPGCMRVLTWLGASAVALGMGAVIVGTPAVASGRFDGDLRPDRSPDAGASKAARDPQGPKPGRSHRCRRPSPPPPRSRPDRVIAWIRGGTGRLEPPPATVTIRSRPPPQQPQSRCLRRRRWCRRPRTSRRRRRSSPAKSSAARRRPGEFGEACSSATARPTNPMPASHRATASPHGDHMPRARRVTAARAAWPKQRKRLQRRQRRGGRLVRQRWQRRRGSGDRQQRIRQQRQPGRRAEGQRRRRLGDGVRTQADAVGGNGGSAGLFGNSGKAATPERQ